jgi:hypothetical protein
VRLPKWVSQWVIDRSARETDTAPGLIRPRQAAISDRVSMSTHGETRELLRRHYVLNAQ